MVYLVTCYHIIENIQNKNVIKAKVNYIDSISNKQISKSLEFRIIGYDIFTDILVGLYDPDLDYNKQFNSNLNIDTVPTLGIDGTSFLQKNETVYTIANIGLTDSNVILEGKLMNNSFRGTYDEQFVLGIPESYLINFNTESGTSGAPLFQENNNNCIGMLVGSIGQGLQYSLALSGFYLSALAYNAIGRWYVYGPAFAFSDINKLNFFIKDIWPKRWFGTINKYYSSSLVSTYPAFSNFNDNKGLVIMDFIIGFDKNNGTFVTNSLELDKYNVIPLNTPLLNTKMYQRFINSGRVPIVIKSILYFQNVESDFDYFGFGLKSNQYGFDVITYDLTQIESLRNDIIYVNGVKRVFPQLSITYYYYNGNTWSEDTELVGGSTPNWYNQYISDSGNLFYQNKFEFPLTLISYLQPYIECLGNICTDEYLDTKDTKNTKDTNMTRLNTNRDKNVTLRNTNTKRDKNVTLRNTNTNRYKNVGEQSQGIVTESTNNLEF